jgi:hypothetical protein
VSNVTNMRYMFSNALSFNQAIGNWNVSEVRNMNGMFKDALSFEQDISMWDMRFASTTHMFSRADVMSR